MFVEKYTQGHCSEQLGEAAGGTRPPGAQDTSTCAADKINTSKQRIVSPTSLGLCTSWLETSVTNHVNINWNFPNISAIITLEIPSWPPELSNDRQTDTISFKALALLSFFYVR